MSAGTATASSFDGGQAGVSTAAGDAAAAPGGDGQAAAGTLAGATAIVTTEYPA